MTKNFSPKEIELADKLRQVILSKLPTVKINGGNISATYQGKTGIATSRQKVVSETSVFFR